MDERLNKEGLREWVCLNKDYILPFFFLVLDEFAKKHLWAKIGIPIIKKFVETLLKNFCHEQEKEKTVEKIN